MSTFLRRESPKWKGKKIKINEHIFIFWCFRWSTSNSNSIILFLQNYKFFCFFFFTLREWNRKRLFGYAYGRVDSARGLLSSVPSTMAYTSQLVSLLLPDLRSDPQSSRSPTYALFLFFFSLLQALAGRWAPGTRLSGRCRNLHRRRRLRFRSPLREAHGTAFSMFGKKIKSFNFFLFLIWIRSVFSNLEKSLAWSIW